MIPQRAHNIRDEAASDDALGALDALRRLSARIGSDRRLIQGAGGNTSLKSGTVMWIKASGTWLRDALERDIMTAVDLPGTRDAIAHGDPAAETTECFTIASGAGKPLRPSIETSMHASLPHRVIVHVHHVDTIALAIRADAAVLLGDRLAGLRWALVPYARPGLPLARAILAAAPAGEVNVLVLANHGLVVAADDVAAAEALLDEVTGRLAIKPRQVDMASGDARSLDRLATVGFRDPRDASTHVLAFDPTGLRLATGGVAYPDHAIFLGPAPLVVQSAADPAAALRAYVDRHGMPPEWAIVPGEGIAVARGIREGGDAMLGCLADVALRTVPDAPLRFLTTEQVIQLTDWEAERYRQRLAASRV